MLLVSLLSVGTSEVRAAADVPAAKRVLLVYSHEREIGLYTGFDRALRSRLQSGARQPIEFYTEYLDLMRFAGPRYRQTSVDYLRVKYAATRIDLIITAGTLAFDFMLEHGDETFPSVPVVLATGAARIAELGGKANLTGIAIKRDVRQTLDLLLALQPDTRQVIVPVGSSPTEEAWGLAMRDLLRSYETRVRITYLSGLPMEGLLHALSELPEHSAVLFTTVYYYDSAGQYFLPEESVANIAARSNAPVYSTDAVFLGSGIVGGVLTDQGPVGDVAGRVGQRVLDGDTPASIPVETIDPNRPTFDARQLQRWHISTARLPAGSVIAFEESGPWQRYKWFIVGAASLLTLQTALILGLVAAQARRRRAESSLRETHLQIRDLAGRLITAQEQERARLARELHDDVGQQMSLLAIELDRLRDMLPESAVDARKQVGGVSEVVAALTSDVHDMSHRLHSSKLEYFGLAVAAGGFCKEVSAHHGVSIEYVHENVPVDLDKDVAISLFRVLQEALSNAAKHAGARRCWVTLRGERDQVTLAVIDDGRGFDADAALKGHGLGLVSMKERLRLVDGDVVIESEPGEGTTVRASAPARTKLVEPAAPARMTLVARV
jgi:signal transduction histidine kinase